MTNNTISPSLASEGASIVTEYFESFKNIEEYMRTEKLKAIERNVETTFPGMELKHDLFSDFDMSPEDMNFEIIENPNRYTFDSLLEITTSHVGKQSIPGKTVKWIVKETTTNKVVGFIRFGSPMMMCAPRNTYLGGVPKDMKKFNNHAIMGFTIVPTQPFGFNYLGGKLLALMCVSHFARRTINAKYDTNIILFETTSLYGSTKGVSQYDGLKPFIRYKGETLSNFLPQIKDVGFTKTFHDKVIKELQITELVKPDTSSRKLMIQNKLLKLIKDSLPDATNFKQTLEEALNLTEKKRYYTSDYGIENIQDIIHNKTDKLIKKPNYDNFELEYIIEWWRKKSIKRYNKLKQDNRLRMNQEVWNESDIAKDIDIIR